MIPEGITIFGFTIYFYGILIMLGALAATWLASRRAREYGQNPDMAWDLLPWALIGGIIGARIWHIFTPPASMVAVGKTTEYYFTHPLEMLNFRLGGLGIPGAVIGGFLAVLIYTRRREISVLIWADIIAPGLALAQAIGRWGNFFNQELYGGPTDLPWKLFIAPNKRLAEFQSVEYYHPLFFYEFLWNLFNAGFLIWIGRRFKDRLFPGDLFLMYMVIYGVGRFLLEFLRLDPSPVAGLNVNQTLMGLIALFSALGLVARHRFFPRPVVSQPARDVTDSQKSLDQ
jgi:phosphatidylglycerol:prolipoprotein diacylglycerol transferase